MATKNVRQILQKELKTPINRLYDAAKMREFASTYKRHTIRRYIRPQDAIKRNTAGLPLSERIRDTPLDYYQLYCRMVIP